MDDKYERILRIGEGAFGTVYKCLDRDTNEIVAIKKIVFNDVYEGVPSSVIREVSLLKELEHNNIVRLLDVQSDWNEVNLVFEYLHLDLSEYLRTTVLDPCSIKRFLHQILCGIAYSHSHKILHRDLKPSNLLVDPNEKIVKIADFGLARAVGVPPTTLTHEVVTLNYRAPELLLGTTKYSTSVDVWAVGCIFGEMVTRQPLFRGMIDIDILFEIFRFFGVPDEDTWPGVTSLSTNVSIISLLPTVKENLADVVTGLEPAGFDLLSRMLCLNPTKRITSYAALYHPYFKDMQNAP